MRNISKIILATILTLGFSCYSWGAISSLRVPSILKQSKQLIVVVTDSWDAYQGQLQQFARNKVSESWHAVGHPWPVVVGKKGLGWDAALQKYQLSGPIKKEGDKKAPAGAFSLGPIFGFARVPDQQIKMAYLPILATTICVDDVHSKYYGRIIDSAKIKTKDWNSGEIMINYPQQYHQGIVVNYNLGSKKILGGGSCIFMHIIGDKNGTVGCTAMAQSDLEKIIYELKPVEHPVLVQLPKAQYQELQKSWKLPALYEDVHK